MLVSKICLTGGPCAGKTTALTNIEQVLTNMGYKVFIINECATRLINAGVKSFGEDKIDYLMFQEFMLKNQLLEEETFEKVASIIDKKCIIICDRGIFDIRSYLNEEEFNMLLDKYNLSKLDLMDNYNLVIHLNTVAKGKPELYTLDNNKARKEGIKEAILRDDLCENAWSFHNNLIIINNNTDFDNKINKIINVIKNDLGAKVQKQRKYLISLNDDFINEIKKHECTKIKIIQTYLKYKDDYELRLRKRILNNNETYYVSIRKSCNDESKIVAEEKINKKSYLELLNNNEILNQVIKDRINFIDNDNLYKIDIYNDGMCILETSSNMVIPSFINVLKEVTGNDLYYNKNIKIMI